MTHEPPSRWNASLLCSGSFIYFVGKFDIETYGHGR